MPYVLSLILLVALSGCGSIGQGTAALTGDCTEICHKGVVYLQFTSGASVMIHQDGSIVTCPMQGN